jgi:hypothetical protein
MNISVDKRRTGEKSDAFLHSSRNVSAGLVLAVFRVW